ncbi:MAG TPA: hypothetical protein VKQ30_12465 [Ktedonobacterales bacterium]|nr:hypothetical protein [Ktedonobacterales bacterium]
MRAILRRRRTIVAAVIVLLLVVAGIVGFNPWTANHFGYALPGADGLPSRIHYGGRDYAASGYCAGADWCKVHQRVCWSEEKLHVLNMWPLTQVGQIVTLFSRAYPIMGQAGPSGLTTTLLFVPSGSCYVVYELEGGP